MLKSSFSFCNNDASKRVTAARNAVLELVNDDNVGINVVKSFWLCQKWVPYGRGAVEGLYLASHKAVVRLRKRLSLHRRSQPRSTTALAPVGDLLLG